MSPMLLLLNLLLTALLTGLIWTIQLVHYPTLAAAGPTAFRTLHRLHCRAITPLVAPLMVGELLASIALWLTAPTNALFALLTLLTLALWAVTGLLHVPLHQKLAAAFSPALARQLVRSNWIRTALWSLRLLLLTSLATANLTPES